MKVKLYIATKYQPPQLLFMEIFSSSMLALYLKLQTNLESLPPTYYMIYKAIYE